MSRDPATGDTSPAAKATANSGGKKGISKSGSPADVGQLLRGAYKQTVEETIPDDLMDLLNRLE